MGFYEYRKYLNNIHTPVAERCDKVINKMLSSIKYTKIKFSGGVEYKYRLRSRRNFVKILTLETACLLKRFDSGCQIAMAFRSHWMHFKK